jgi:hypothetical protein
MYTNLNPYDMLKSLDIVRKNKDPSWINLILI